MTSSTTISFTLDTTDPSAELGFEAWLDSQKFVDIDHVQSCQVIELAMPENDGEHELKFILKNKTSQHTKVDVDGNIISDARLTLSELAFDEIQLGNTGTKLSVYTHNFNGTQTEIQDEFYGEMGCNGVVTLKFSTPIYIWLLENM